MTIFLVETYVTKPDKLEEFTTLLKKFEAYMKKASRLVQRGKVAQDFQSSAWGQLGWLC